MFELITQCRAPVPPAPQPPYEEVANYPPYNEEGQTRFDDIFNEERYKDFRISYCPILLDPAYEEEMAPISRQLRETVFKCREYSTLARPPHQVQIPFKTFPIFQFSISLSLSFSGNVIKERHPYI